MATEKRSKEGGPPSGLRAPTSSVSYRDVPSDSANIDRADNVRRTTVYVSWWKRRSPTEKRLIVCLPLFIILLIVVIVVITAVTVPSPAELLGRKLNTSLAASIMDSINRSIDPCEDFFEYACGSRPHIPRAYKMSNHFTRINDELDELLGGLLERRDTEYDTEAIRKAKGLYKVCTREGVDLIEKKLWLTIFLQTGDHVPSEKYRWNETTLDLTQFLARLRLHLGIDGLFTMYVDSDAKNSDRNIIYFDQPRFAPRVGQSTTQNSALFYALLSTLYPSATTNSSSSSSHSSSSSSSSSSSTNNNATSSSYFASSEAEELKEVAEFGDELRKIMVAESQRRYRYLLYNRMTVADMYSNLTKEIDWLEFLRVIFSAVNITIELDEPIVVLESDYFVKLGQLLNRTSSRVVTNYLFWNTRVYPFEDISGHQETLDQMHDTSDGDPQPVYYYWRRCLYFVKQHLGMAATRIYIDAHFKKKSKETVEQLVGEIKAAFYESVDEADWMDDTSKELVKEKMRLMKGKVAYPDFIFNDTTLNDLYKDIVIQPRNLTETVAGVLEVTSKQSIAKLRRPVDIQSWLLSPIFVNAFYVPFRNEIIIPASVIQTPFYREINSPSALNFGGIGFIIGHEVIHGFGDRGRRYDKKGNLSVWWSEEMTAKFDELTSCFVEQYNNYTVSQSNIKIDGLRTLGENIADNGGLRQSFRAYRRWVKNQGREEDLLPGLNLTGNQLFFLQFAQAMCSRVEIEEYGDPLKPNRHCPTDIRVWGTLSNSDDFAQAYGCKVGRRMNPVRNCILW